MSKVMNIKSLGATLLVAFGLVLSSCLTYAQDWGGLQRFEAANAALADPVAGQPRVVLMGDSITEEWLRLRPDFFSSNGYVGRGISGQVSAQMLVRFRQDVIECFAFRKTLFEFSCLCGERFVTQLFILIFKFINISDAFCVGVRLFFDRV